jgi:hypothetical protein
MKKIEESNNLNSMNGIRRVRLGNQGDGPMRDAVGQTYGISTYPTMSIGTGQTITDRSYASDQGTVISKL